MFLVLVFDIYLHVIVKEAPFLIDNQYNLIYEMYLKSTGRLFYLFVCIHIYYANIIRGFSDF